MTAADFVALMAPDAASRPTPLALLIAHAEARALLWRAGEFDLADAIDELEAEAEVSGLTAAIGADEVEAIIAAAFTQPVPDRWIADGWAAAAADYQRKRGERSLIVETAPDRLELRALMADNVSLEHAAYELAAARERGGAAATLAAAEYLIQQNDAERWRKWLAQHSARERVGILQHLEQKARRRCQKKT